MLVRWLCVGLVGCAAAGPALRVEPAAIFAH